MYGIETITPAAALPVTVDRLRSHLRLNHQVEDDQLAEFIQAATERFELDTRRPVISTTYRQTFRRWASPLVLGRAGVTAVANVTRILDDGTTAALDAATWRAELTTSPAAIVFPYGLTFPCDWWYRGGQDDDVRPLYRGGYVTFTAGWADATAVPQIVKSAVRLLAAHLYHNREAYRDAPMSAVPITGWEAVCRQFKLGLSGHWGQG